MAKISLIELKTYIFIKLLRSCACSRISFRNLGNTETRQQINEINGVLINVEQIQEKHTILLNMFETRSLRCSIDEFTAISWSNCSFWLCNSTWDFFRFFLVILFPPLKKKINTTGIGKEDKEAEIYESESESSSEVAKSISLFAFSIQLKSADFFRTWCSNFSTLTARSTRVLIWCRIWPSTGNVGSASSIVKGEF